MVMEAFLDHNKGKPAGSAVDSAHDKGNEGRADPALTGAGPCGSDEKEHGHQDAHAFQNHHKKHEEKVKDLEKKIVETEKCYNDMLDSARRIKAEYENYKKRSETQWSDRVDMEKGRIIAEFLPVYDNLERAMAALNKDHRIEDFGSGVQMIIKQFKSAFDRFGITEISAQGVEFDPNLHEAMSLSEDPSVKHETVTGVMEKGYKMGERVLRHARVAVAKPASPSAPAPGAASGPATSGTDGTDAAEPAGPAQTDEKK
jgi:molecular chaperone GrpE